MADRPRIPVTHKGYTQPAAGPRTREAASKLAQSATGRPPTQTGRNLGIAMQGIGAFITKAATTMDLNQGMAAMDDVVRPRLNTNTPGSYEDSKKCLRFH